MSALIQTSVGTNLPRGYAGFTRGDGMDDSVRNTESTLTIPFGVVVVQNAALPTDRQAAKLPTAAANVVLGISRWDHVVTDELDIVTDGYKPGLLMRVRKSGSVLVQVENAVTKGARPFFRITASGPNTQLGKLRSDADGGNATELKGAYFEESGTSGALVWVRLDEVANRAVQP